MPRAVDSPPDERNHPTSASGEEARARGATVVERLFDTHADRLRRYVYRYVRSWEEAQDLVHDLFLRLWDRRQDLDSVADLEGYLYAGARNHALTHLRQRRVEEQWRRRCAGPAILSEGPTLPDDPAQELVSAEISAAVQRAVDALPSRQRQVLLLQWSGSTYQQIAAALNISPKTVSNHLTNAVDHLRRTLPRIIG